MIELKNLTKFPVEVAKLTSLVSLDIHFSKFEAVPKQIAKLTKLAASTPALTSTLDLLTGWTVKEVRRETGKKRARLETNGGDAREITADLSAGDFLPTRSCERSWGSPGSPCRRR